MTTDTFPQNLICVFRKDGHIPTKNYRCMQIYVIIYKKAGRNAKRVKQTQYSVESSVEKVGLVGFDFLFESACWKDSGNQKSVF